MFLKLPILLFFVSAAAASAQHLGETRSAIVAQNGPAIEENHAKATAFYRRGSWKIEVVYSGDVAKTLTVTKLDALSDEEIDVILEQNSDGARWHELSINGPTRMWQRSDLATARCDRLKPRSIEMRDTPFQRTAEGALGKASTVLAQAIMPNLAPTVAPKVAPRPQRSPQTNQALRSPVPSGNPTQQMTETTISKIVATALAWLLIIGSPALALVGFVKMILPMWAKRGVKGFSEARATNRRAVPPPTDPRPAAGALNLASPSKSLSLTVDDLAWEDFELLAGELFRRQGYEVEIGAALGPDGGKDLTLRRGEEKVLVQCKCFAAGNKVSVMAMREFYGLIMAEGAQRGIFMTTGLYSRDAREFADAKPIGLLGRAAVERMIADATRPGENLYDVSSWVNDFAAGARVVDPSCPRCRRPMKLRRGAMGKAFWGCTYFPGCRGKRDARAELVQAFSYQGR